MFFKKLLLATGNRHKYEEFLALLPPDISPSLVFAPDFAAEIPAADLEETGTTYAMNACIKALAWADVSGLPSLADDSGIEVEALAWKPGVRSARIVEGSDADRNAWLLERMRGQCCRRAHYVAAIALAVPGQWTIICEGICSGTLAESPSGEHGFGYDPLFIPDGYEISFGELPATEKNKISHRLRALQELFRILKERRGYS